MKTPSQTFTPSDRLRKASDFERVFRGNCLQRGRFLLLHACLNNCHHPRLGRIVSKRWGNAVRRNRLRRWIRESFRELKPQVKLPLDCVVIPLNTDGLTYQLLRRDMEELIRRAEIQLSQAT